MFLIFWKNNYFLILLENLIALLQLSHKRDALKYQKKFLVLDICLRKFQLPYVI